MLKDYGLLKKDCLPEVHNLQNHRTIMTLQFASNIFTQASNNQISMLYLLMHLLLQRPAQKTRKVLMKQKKVANFTFAFMIPPRKFIF